MPPRQHAPSRRARRNASAARARRARAPIGQGQRRELVRNRLIESRLTPNAISLTGLALNLVAAVLVWEQLFFLGGIAFIVGSIMDTLDGRYSRMSGKGTPFGAFLDSTLDRIEEGIVLTAVAGYFALQGNRVAAAGVVVAVLASLMVSYTRARAEALGVECKVGHRHAAGARRDPLDRPGVREGRLARRLRTARAGRLRARRAQRDHRRAAHLARAPRAVGVTFARPRSSLLRAAGHPAAAAPEQAREPATARPLDRAIAPRKGHRTRDQAAQQRPRRRQRRRLHQRRRALPVREGPRRDHRRRQLRLGLRAGRPVLQGRRPDRSASRA